jgi:hypothetical protein
MNYIPGFSNYLETTAPRYARGGRARFTENEMYEGDMYNTGAYGTEPYVAPYVAPAATTSAPPIMETAQQPAVMPMTTEAVAAGPETDASTAYANALAALTKAQALSDADAIFTTKQLAGTKANPNSIYELANPDEYFKAYGTVPISFTGNSAYMDKGVKGPSVDYLTPEAGASYSLYSPKTGELIASGTGAEGLLALSKQANALNESQGRSADFQLVKQSAGSSSPEIIGSNLYNSDRTALGKVAGVVGQALPLAALAIPGLNVLGGIAVGAGLGGAGAAMQGKDVLGGAAMGGLSAAGGSVLGKALQAGGTFGTALAPRLATAIGTGIGSTAGGLVTGQSLKNALLSGVASGGLSYLSPSIQEGLGIGKAPSVNASTGGGGDIVVSGYRPTSIGTSLGGSPNKIQQALKPKTEAPYDGLTVTGSRLGNTFGVDLGGNQFGAPGQDQSAFEKMYSEPYDPNEILVKATPATQSTPVSVPVTGGLSPDVLAGMAEFEKNPIISEGSKIEQPTPVSVPVTSGLPTDIVVNALGKEKGLPEGSVLADLGIPQVPTSDPALTKKPLGVKDYLEIASLLPALIPDGKGGSDQTGTYTRGGGSLNPIFSAKLPSAGGLGAVGVNRTVRPMGDVDWLTYGTRPELNFYDYAAQNNPAPVTTPVPGNPAGPIMAERDPMAMAKGGRTEFAVNGPGTGRSDDIPAVLSDGEYVIDAETVALLGDGSSKAGAKKLDDLRVKVRKHKGQKLAKGRFSANAKKPEAYLSGGRI